MLKQHSPKGKANNPSMCHNRALMQGWSVRDSAMAGEGLGWLSTAGNLACLSWLCLALYLNWQAKGAPDEAIFLLAPSLLLLNRDPLLLPGLKPSRRYAPCSLAVSLYLLLSGVASVVHATYLQPHALATAHQQTFSYLLLNLACLAAVVPMHAGFLQVTACHHPPTSCCAVVMSEATQAVVWPAC